jgi:hypothetical protein
VPMLSALLVCVVSVPQCGAAPETSTAETAEVAATNPARVGGGLIAWYGFDDEAGSVIHNQSRFGALLDLTIEDLSAVERQGGKLVVKSATKIATADAATALTNAVQHTSAITVEAWIETADRKQTGPARIISVSGNASQRNVTLGQDGDRYDVRLRTTGTSTNGVPSVSSQKGDVRTALTHVVYTRDSAGSSFIYVDGKRQASKNVPGSLMTWDSRFPLVLANEASGDRPWLGSFHLVAIYARALTGPEIEQNFRAGSNASADDADSDQPQVAPSAATAARILTRNCLQCHDAVTQEGGLDLSRRAQALAGGDSGAVLVPGKANESLLMERVAHNEMPPEGPGLTEDEKSELREWIEQGAEWPGDWIDPAVYAHEPKADQIWVKRLTVPEYIETVRSTIGVDIAREARELLPADLRADGFRNTMYNLNVDLAHVQAYARLAEMIVERMDALAFAQRFSESQSLSTDDTMRDFIAAMGKWIFRGPLNEREITNFSGMATAVASAGGDYEEAVRYILEAMLQSPRFIYLVENQHGDGTPWPCQRL